MGQRSIEILVGCLVTDEEFRRRFVSEPHETIRLMRQRGLELTTAEIDALLASPITLWERLAAALNELAGEPLVRAHHGSLARPQRIEIEDRLKAGQIRGLVATSSLELGIDMGAIDLVIQIEAPPSVASGMQRIGRSGVTSTSTMTCLCSQEKPSK